MNEEQIQDYMKFLIKFCSENEGNRMNQWLAKGFLDSAYVQLKKYLIQSSMQSQEAPKIPLK